ncbi:DMT family transporter [Pseudohoeflea suaedae]|uniref:DMT family transporter n=1 Tax=Pseudohoeflea suaedae TaxID=877384 RepID=A0A4R5PQ96_9HYPH|nr:DMT family transporter [Pseudohoeflea suaedae]TDH39209.1 DMT family transporter [Pseudohoeflea suaedae]
MTSSKYGYAFAFLAVTIFALQDGISKYLGEQYPPIFIAMIRYFAFAGFALVLAARAPGGIKAASRSKRPVVQVVRSFLLVLQIVVAIQAFAVVGLIQSQAIFASGPIFVALLSMPVLGERVGWRRWLAIVIGLVGVVILLNPGFSDASDALNWNVLWPLGGAVMMGAYAVSTRLAGRSDSSMTSFLYTGIIGWLVLIVIGPFFLADPTPGDWVWIAILCVTGMSSHFFLIKAYEYLDAVAVQPVSYFQLVVGGFIGVLVFGEQIHLNLLIGAGIVIAAGAFTVWREHVVGRRKAAAEKAVLAPASRDGA